MPVGRRHGDGALGQQTGRLENLGLMEFSSRQRCRVSDPSAGDEFLTLLDSAIKRTSFSESRRVSTSVGFRLVSQHDEFWNSSMLTHDGLVSQIERMALSQSIAGVRHQTHFLRTIVPGLGREHLHRTGDSNWCGRQERPTCTRCGPPFSGKQ